MKEHEFERENGFAVQHFRHLHITGEPTPAVSVTLTVESDGTSMVEIGVEDDEYSVDMAERTALAMLDAVKLARS